MKKAELSNRRLRYCNALVLVDRRGHESWVCPDCWNCGMHRAPTRFKKPWTLREKIQATKRQLELKAS